MILALLLAAAAAPEGASSLDAARVALDEFQLNEALAILERARDEGPYTWAEHVRLEELLGTAYAYLGRNEEAAAAFDRLLALDPRHAVSYTLSPKVTFIFERAREQARLRSVPALEVSWPAELLAGEPVPIELEVAADPHHFFATATLHHRARGEAQYTQLEVRLPALGARERLVLPPPPVTSERDSVLELWLVARNPRGDEVYTWYSPAHPRDLTLRWVPPDPWYGKWWVWVVAGGVVAAASVGVAAAATHEPGREAGLGAVYR